MLIKLFDIINDKKTSLDLHEEDKKNISQEIIMSSIRRLRVIIWSILLIEPFLIFFIDIPRIKASIPQNAALHTEWIYWAYLVCHLILIAASVPIAFITLRLAGRSENYLKHLNNIIAVFLPVIGMSIFAFIDMLDHVTTGQGTVYAIYALIMCSVFLIKPPINVIVMVLPHLAYVAMNFIFIQDRTVLAANLINTTAMILTMILFNLFLYYSFENHIKKNIILKRKNQELEYLASHDMLTGILNRAAFLDYITSYQTGTIMLIDIDFFKLINDKYSHLAGDFVLTEFTRRITEAFREASTARWGGEEFIVFWREGDEDKLAEEVEQFRIQLMEKEFVYKQTPIRVTASFGLTYLKSDYEAAFVRADQALYRAKEEGRNKVVCSF